MPSSEIVLTGRGISRGVSRAVFVTNPILHSVLRVVTISGRPARSNYMTNQGSDALRNQPQERGGFRDESRLVAKLSGPSQNFGAAHQIMQRGPLQKLSSRIFACVGGGSSG